MSKAALKAGLVYIAGHVDLSGEVYLIDVGVDAIHSDLIILASWDERTNPETGSFVETIFPPGYLAHDYTPELNVRVAYDHGFEFTATEQRGVWEGVRFYDIAPAQRTRFREANEESYQHDAEYLQQLYELLE